MNILIGSNVHWWNAEAAYAAVTAKLLKEDGHRVFVHSRPGSDNEKKLRNLGLEVIMEPDLNTQNPLKLLQSYFLLKRFLQKEKIEIVNPHRSEGFPLYALVRKSLTSFRLVRTRGASRKVKPHWPNRVLHCDWTDAIIVPGKIVEERDLAGIPISRDSLHVIYYPVDLIKIPPQETLNEYRNEFSIPQNHKILAIVGRIRKERDT